MTNFTKHIMYSGHLALVSECIYYLTTILAIYSAYISSTSLESNPARELSILVSATLFPFAAAAAVALAVFVVLCFEVRGLSNCF